MELKVGDYVRIEPLSDEEKQSYPFRWIYQGANPYISMDKFIGTVTKITLISEHSGRPCYYLECDSGAYMWSDSHLKRITKQNIMLF